MEKKTRLIKEPPKKVATPPDNFVGCWTCKYYAADECNKYDEHVPRYYFCTSYYPRP